MMKYGRTIFVALCLAVVCTSGVFSFAEPVAAAGLIPAPTGKCPEDYASPVSKTTPITEPCKDGDRDYSLGDVKSVLVRIGNFMLGVSGAVALVVFTIGGFMWVMSAGNSKYVEKGKELMKSGVIGLVILFSAYTIVAFGVKLFAGAEGAKYLPTVGAPGATPSGAGGATGSASYPISVPMAGVAADQQCGKFGGSGSCEAPTSCGGTLITGACPGTKKCCMTVTDGAQTEPCGKIGGKCQKKTTACSGPYVSGLCSGDADTQCCFPKK